MSARLGLAFNVLLTLAVLDLLILFAALYQVGTGESSGLWSPFWEGQARFFLGLIGAN